MFSPRGDDRLSQSTIDKRQATTTTNKQTNKRRPLPSPPPQTPGSAAQSTPNSSITRFRITSASLPVLPLTAVAMASAPLVSHAAHADAVNDGAVTDHAHPHLPQTTPFAVTAASDAVDVANAASLASVDSTSIVTQGAASHLTPSRKRLPTLLSEPQATLHRAKRLALRNPTDDPNAATTTGASSSAISTSGVADSRGSATNGDVDQHVLTMSPIAQPDSRESEFISGQTRLRRRHARRKRLLPQLPMKDIPLFGLSKHDLFAAQIFTDVAASYDKQDGRILHRSSRYRGQRRHRRRHVSLSPSDTCRHPWSSIPLDPTLATVTGARTNASPSNQAESADEPNDAAGSCVLATRKSINEIRGFDFDSEGCDSFMSAGEYHNNEDDDIYDIDSLDDDSTNENDVDDDSDGAEISSIDSARMEVNTRTEVARKRQKLRQPTTITDLPTEILDTIFELVTTSPFYPPIPQSPRPGYIHLLRLCAPVCRRWADIALPIARRLKYIDLVVPRIKTPSLVAAAQSRNREWGRICMLAVACLHRHEWGLGAPRLFFVDVERASEYAKTSNANSNDNISAQIRHVAPTTRPGLSIGENIDAGALGPETLSRPPSVSAAPMQPSEASLELQEYHVAPETISKIISEAEHATLERFRAISGTLSSLESPTSSDLTVTSLASPKQPYDAEVVRAFSRHFPDPASPAWSQLLSCSMDLHDSFLELATGQPSPPTLLSTHVSVTYQNDSIACFHQSAVDDLSGMAVSAVASASTAPDTNTMSSTTTATAAAASANALTSVAGVSVNVNITNNSGVGSNSNSTTVQTIGINTSSISPQSDGPLSSAVTRNGFQSTHSLSLNAFSLSDYCRFTRPPIVSDVPGLEKSAYLPYELVSEGILVAETTSSAASGSIEPSGIQPSTIGNGVSQINYTTDPFWSTPRRLTSERDGGSQPIPLSTMTAPKLSTSSSVPPLVLDRKMDPALRLKGRLTPNQFHAPMMLRYSERMDIGCYLIYIDLDDGRGGVLLRAKPIGPVSDTHPRGSGRIILWDETTYGCCSRCQCRLVRVQVCADCRVAQYCSRSCQRLDWDSGHRGTCRTLGLYMNSPHVDGVGPDPAAIVAVADAAAAATVVMNTVEATAAAAADTVVDFPAFTP